MHRLSTPSSEPVSHVWSVRLLASSAVVGLVALLGTAVVTAADFGVRVLDPSGEPIAGAAVCIGMPGNPRQFGSRITGRDGLVRLDVPNVPLVVTVSRTRFTAVRLNEPARNFNLVREVTLRDGQAGPRCRADSSLAAQAVTPKGAEIVIERLEFDRSRGTVIRPIVTGTTPTHYRIGTSSDLDDVAWRELSSDIVLDGAMRDEPYVFLQLRRRIGSENAWIETRSRAITVRLEELRSSTG